MRKTRGGYAFSNQGTYSIHPLLYHGLSSCPCLRIRAVAKSVGTSEDAAVNRRRWVASCAGPPSAGSSRPALGTVKRQCDSRIQRSAHIAADAHTAPSYPPERRNLQLIRPYSRHVSCAYPSPQLQRGTCLSPDSDPRRSHGRRWLKPYA